MNWPGFQYRQRHERFLTSKTSEPSLGPTIFILNGYGHKATGTWSCSPPSSSEVKNEWTYTSVPPICLHGVHKKNFNFTSRTVRCTGTNHSKPLDHEIPKFRHRDHKISQLVLILSWLNPIINYTIYFCNINFKIILPSMTFKMSLSSEFLSGM